MSESAIVSRVALGLCVLFAAAEAFARDAFFRITQPETLLVTSATALSQAIQNETEFQSQVAGICLWNDKRALVTAKLKFRSKFGNNTNAGTPTPNVFRLKSNKSSHSVVYTLYFDGDAGNFQPLVDASPPENGVGTATVLEENSNFFNRNIDDCSGGHNRYIRIHIAASEVVKMRGGHIYNDELTLTLTEF